jgi:hypothetical protein
MCHSYHEVNHYVDVLINLGYEADLSLIYYDHWLAQIMQYLLANTIGISITRLISM